MNNSYADLQEKVAVVSGGSSGIGKSIATLLGENGVKVAVVAGRNKLAGREVAENITSEGGVARAFHCNITEEKQVKGIIDNVLAIFGKIDILVNSAGIIGPTTTIDKIKISDWNRVFQVNVTGTFLCCKHCIPVMKKQGHGNIINISSTAGFKASMISSCYSASKGALISMTKSLALAHAEDGVRVNCICPGTIDTPMTQDFFEHEKNQNKREALRNKFLNRHPLQRFGTADDVAYGALFLASNCTSFITGINLVIDGGITL